MNEPAASASLHVAGGRPLPAPPGWPAPAGPAAWAGMAGAIAETIAPATEADPVAILAQLLIGAGAVIGRGAWVTVEATRHHPNEFAVLVGDSAKARKGSSWDHVEAVLARADPGFAARTRSGLSTGEGLIWAARDPDGTDPGNPDPRLLVVEAEFVSVLKATGRDINTLSPVLRAAWDSRPLATLTRSSPMRATRAHIAVIGCSYVKRNQGISPVGPGQRGRSPRVGEALLSRLTGGAEDGPDR